MTPREKAKELFDTFYGNNTDYIDSNKDAEESAITCALIAVEEIIKSLTPVNGRTINGEYWQEVKKELESL